MSEIGHNSGDSFRVASDELRQFVERVEHLDQEKKDVAEQIKEVYAEAKGRGYDVKALRKLISIRKQDPEKRTEENAVLNLYGVALGIDVFG